MAAQIWCHSVAAGISFLVKVKELQDDAMSTAKFVEHFDVLFNTFNSKTLKSSQRHGNAFNDLSHHHAFLEQSLKFLDDIKTLGGIELPCIFGWKLCIHALFSLWEYLKTQQNFKFILTNRLTQDCAENLFSIIRVKGGFEITQMQVNSKKHLSMLWLISYLLRVVRAIVKLIMTKYYWTLAVLQWQNI